MNILFKKLTDTAQPPTYGTEGAACMDVYADIRWYKTAPPQGAVSIPTGLAFEVPQNHVMLVFSRSGHGFKHGVRLSNCVGVLDSDFRGELMVRLHNDGDMPFDVAPGDRIAQVMVLPVEPMHLVEVDELSETKRGIGGFGSTGK